ncbi:MULTISPECIES: hypothetical protein [unclassified Chryseobacterium]|uniref:hypothetical protein n=1 Tax=unclassified Chryseobacterium TaxID=2593645 RepID=UPI003018EAD8
MNESLKKSIENLYSVFSKYEIRSFIEGCPCCVSDRDKEKIHSKELRELEEEDLSRYAFKAMTTWGNVDDFKHFLPRILELCIDHDLGIHPFGIFGKLKYGKWEVWNDAEKEAVITFLLEWWKCFLENRTFFDDDLFFGIYNMTGEIERLLAYWKVDIAQNSFMIYVDFIRGHYPDFVNENRENKIFDESDHEKFLKWIKENAISLEEGFYYFEKRDERFAREISDALYILEHS